MRASEVRTADDARKIIEERNLSHGKVGVFDIDGVLRGKYMARDKFLSALEGGFGFCDVVMGWDSQDQLYDNVKFTGWHTGYPDAKVRVAPETCREIPWEVQARHSPTSSGRSASWSFSSVALAWSRMISRTWLRRWKKASVSLVVMVRSPGM